MLSATFYNLLPSGYTGYRRLSYPTQLQNGYNNRGATLTVASTSSSICRSHWAVTRSAFFLNSNSIRARWVSAPSFYLAASLSSLSIPSYILLSSLSHPYLLHFLLECAHILLVFPKLSVQFSI